jgi:hypothetical protein
MTYPNFVIVGCPKCGTTSVADWLKQHPECDSTDPKEPFYFMDVSYEDRIPGFNELGLEGYKKLFSSVSNVPVRFEATTHYYYQSVAPISLKKIDPEMKILALFRQPSDRYYSWYNFNLNHLAAIDPSLSFSDLVDLVLSGRLEEKRSCFRNEETFDFFRYGIAHGEYIKFIDRWVSVFGDNFKVLLVEDVKGREDEVMAGLSEWLEIDPSFYIDFNFRSSNVSYSIRNKLIHRLATSLAKSDKFGGVPRQLLARLYWAFQADRTKKVVNKQDQHALKLLDDYYKPSINSLANFLDRPELITIWHKNRLTG